MLVAVFNEFLKTHKIFKYPDGRYYIGFDIVTAWDQEVATCTAGGFNTFDEAREALFKHSPDAVGVIREGEL